MRRARQLSSILITLGLATYDVPAGLLGPVTVRTEPLIVLGVSS